MYLNELEEKIKKDFASLYSRRNDLKRDECDLEFQQQVIDLFFCIEKYNEASSVFSIEIKAQFNLEKNEKKVKERLAELEEGSIENEEEALLRGALSLPHTNWYQDIIVRNDIELLGERKDIDEFLFVRSIYETFDARMILCRCWAEGGNNISKSKEKLNKYADLGWSSALFELANNYYKGINDFEKDLEKALVYYNKLKEGAENIGLDFFDKEIIPIEGILNRIAAIEEEMIV